MDNKELWKRVCVTDPRNVKTITGKQYKGNSPKPYWIVERLTDEFGPCGIGWGFTILSERMERLTETDVLHVAVVRLWYVMDGKRGEFEQIGQTKAVYSKASGGLMVDEDAPKKSVTDALVKCASYLGFAGDIFAGLWDDSKYVQWADEEWRRKEAPKLTPREEELLAFATFLVECHESGRDIDAIKAYYLPHNWSGDNPTEQEEKKFVWRELHPWSKLRSAIKANKPE